MHARLALLALVLAGCGGAAFTEGPSDAGGDTASVADAGADAPIFFDASPPPSDGAAGCARKCPAGFECVLGACVDPVADHFSPTANPAGNWSYGWAASLGGAVTPYTARATIESTLDAWELTNGSLVPSVFQNSSGGAAVYQGNFTMDPGEVGLQPGPAAQRSVVRWTAPEAGLYTIDAHFIGLSGANATALTTVDVAIFQNATVLTGQTLNTNGGGNDVPFKQLHTSVAAGDHLDFSVGWGNDMADADDETGLRLVITAE